MITSILTVIFLIMAILVMLIAYFKVKSLNKTIFNIYERYNLDIKTEAKIKAKYIRIQNILIGKYVELLDTNAQSDTYADEMIALLYTQIKWIWKDTDLVEMNRDLEEQQLRKSK